jgi:hydrogenase maturation protease
MGNVLLQDEGAGVHAVRALQQTLPDGRGDLALLDGGTCPDVLSLLPEGIERLIIVDAVQGGGEPGTLYRFTPDDADLWARAITSVHQLGLAEGLALMAVATRIPEDVVIIGVEPKVIGWGLQLSPEIQARIPRITELVEREIERA